MSNTSKMPEAAVKAMQLAYRKAETILEYGSGNSTLYAAGLKGKKIVSVESDRNWAHDLGLKLGEANTQSIPLIHFSYIGEVGNWGKPVNNEHFQNFPDYVLSPWRLTGFTNPDVVLIDGRFRVACFLATCIKTTKPITILFDDYTTRPEYHLVEEWFRPVQFADRMAIFNITPTTVNSGNLDILISAFFQMRTAISSALKPSLTGHLNSAENLSAAAKSDLEQTYRKKIRQLRRQRRLLSIPYAVALAPITLSYLGWRIARKFFLKSSARLASDNGTLNNYMRVKIDNRAVERYSFKHAKIPANPNDAPDNFVLYRILGNDLEPRHAEGQTIQNLKFILEHEENLAACEKRWLVNRIYDPVHEATIIDLLKTHDQKYDRIPFTFSEYEKITMDYQRFPGSMNFFNSPEFEKMSSDAKLRAHVSALRLKNLYVMNNNGARNAALAVGRPLAKWVLPWDGNCFIMPEAWEAIRAGIGENRNLQYITVPMARMMVNSSNSNSSSRSQATDEPQVIFRSDAEEIFDEAHPYGRRPKVELLMRLGVPGPYYGWKSDTWDLPIGQKRMERGTFGSFGWVARLSSGRSRLDMSRNGASKSRAVSRDISILKTLQKLDDEVLRRKAPWYREAKDSVVKI